MKVTVRILFSHAHTTQALTTALDTLTTIFNNTRVGLQGSAIVLPVT